MSLDTSVFKGACKAPTLATDGSSENRTKSDIHRRETFSVVTSLPFCLFVTIAVFFLWQDHRVHLFGTLPYVLLLLCPVIHLFMQRGHHGTGHEPTAAR